MIDECQMRRSILAWIVASLPMWWAAFWLGIVDITTSSLAFWVITVPMAIFAAWLTPVLAARWRRPAPARGLSVEPHRKEDTPCPN